jgi:hypothetical protein
MDLSNPPGWRSATYKEEHRFVFCRLNSFLNSAPLPAMSDIPPSTLQYIRNFHLCTFMELTLGSGEGNGVLAERMHRLVRLRASPNLYPNELCARVQWLYAELSLSLMLPDPCLPRGSLCFPLEFFPTYAASDAFRGTNGRDYLIIDINETELDGQRIVPMKTFMPYADAPKRRRELLDATDMLPLFFVNTDLSVGFLLAGTPNGIPEDKMFTRSNRTSLKIRFAVRGLCSHHVDTASD